MTSGSKFIRQVVSIMAMVAVPLAQEQDFQVHLVPSTDQPCLETAITLTCSHPDVLSPQLLDSNPQWTEDGEVFTPVGSVFSSDLTSRTTSVLNVTISPTHFQHHGHAYTCFLRTHEGRISSNSVTVNPLRSPLKPSIEAVQLGSSNVSVVWTQNRTCFSMCTFEYKLTLFNSTGSVHYTLMTTQHSTHISGLLPGVPYTLELVALCKEYTSSTTDYKFILPVTDEDYASQSAIISSVNSTPPLVFADIDSTSMITTPSKAPEALPLHFTLIISICATGGIVGCCVLSALFGGFLCCVCHCVKMQEEHHCDAGSKDSNSRRSIENLSVHVEQITMQENPCYEYIEKITIYEHLQ